MAKVSAIKRSSLAVSMAADGRSFCVEGGVRRRKKRLEPDITVSRDVKHQEAELAIQRELKAKII